MDAGQHEEAQAERITKAGLTALKLPVAVSELTGRAKGPLEKGAIATVIRERTGVSNRWIADRLEMGHESSVTRAMKLAREDREGKKMVKSLKALLVLVFKDWYPRLRFACCMAPPWRGDRRGRFFFSHPQSPISDHFPGCFRW